MPVRKFVENNSPSQNIFNLRCGIQRGKILKFEELWEFWDNWDKLAASDSGTQMKVIDAKNYIKKSRGTISLTLQRSVIELVFFTVLASATGSTCEQNHRRERIDFLDKWSFFGSGFGFVNNVGSRSGSGFKAGMLSLNILLFLFLNH